MVLPAHCGEEIPNFANGGLVIVIVLIVSEIQPTSVIACSFTLYVPGSEYFFTGFFTVSVVLSPKSQFHFIAGRPFPFVASKNCTASVTQPEWVAVQSIVGGAKTETS